ncbi:helix-turn-helix transcriptional regulator [Microbacterium oleivorans]|uniref:helix-turn-helix domain-containing protein n=1 Tax=Microbacterium oleivorans TaxID=273677 RepID=UPI0034258FF9
MPSGSQPLPGPLSKAVADLLSSNIASGGFRQGTIARAAGLSASQLSRCLSGQKVFTLDQLDAVCQALGVSISDIVGHADQLSRQRIVPANVIEAQFGAAPPADLAAVARKRDRESGEDIDGP